MRSATAKIAITPPVGLAMSGFAARTEPSTGKLDELWARAASFSDGRKRVVIVALDIIGVDDRLTRRIKDEAAIKIGGGLKTHVIVSATHTHAGPAVLPQSMLGAVDKSYVTLLVKKASDACAMAAGAEVPTGRIDVGMSVSKSVGANRRTPDGPVDKRLYTLTALPKRAEDGIGDRGDFPVVLNYACHGVALGPQNTKYSSDYIHFTRTALERAIPGSCAVFTQSASGDINTGHSAQASIAGQSLGRTYADAERLGLVLGDDAIEAVRSTILSEEGASSAIRFAEDVIALPLKPASAKGEYLQMAAMYDELARSQGDKSGLGLARADRTRAEWARLMAFAKQLPDAVEAHISAFSIGPALFVTFPGEALTEYAVALRQEAEGRPLFVLTCTDGAAGYVPSAGEIIKGGYEVADSYHFYGMPAPYSEAAYDIALRKAKQLIASITR
ncbi:MAG TPA: neutral/alkaline non-lysosomal ceramidase N-terminal domain-containing protein [Bacillota bacterium]|nr:neutral/alkaline non-lysosomal ceramidase N-terminal domain-containing protein [Bacillota bacterium]